MLPSLRSIAVAAAAALAYAHRATGAPLAVPPPQSRTLTLWLYAPTASNDTWAQWYADITAHRPNVTGVAPCSYLIDGTGAFVTQFPNQSAYEIAKNWTIQFAQAGLQTLPLLAASGSGMNAIISNATLANAVIAATLQEAISGQLDGYNIQLEEPGSPTIQTQWTAFLTQWLDAFGAHGKSITIIIGGYCHARDWMYMDCGNYRAIAQNATKPRSNLFVVTEATYTGEPSNVLAMLPWINHGLQGIATLGMEYNPPLTNPWNGVLDAVLSYNISSIYVWVNTPTDAPGWDAWDAFGYFLTSNGAGAMQPVEDAAPALTLLAIGDWGGSGLPPYYTEPQVQCAAAMGALAASTVPPIAGVLALGDNFYPLGICNNETFFTCNTTDPGAGTAFDQRFNSTFESVYNAPALATTPFYVVAGNHDSLGSRTAQLAYSGRSQRWRFPWYYYTLQWSLLPPSASSSGTWEWVKVDARLPAATLHMVIMQTDPTLCYGVFSDDYHNQTCTEQWEWINATLPVVSRTADFLLVTGHYPLYSACAHGNTDYVIQTLLPLLLQYNVTAYVSAHDHCAEHLQLPIDTGVFDMFVSGTGDGCCYADSNINGTAPAVLRYLMAGGHNPTNETSGFARLVVTPQPPSFAVHFHGGNGTLLYTSDAIPPRMLPTMSAML